MALTNIWILSTKCWLAVDGLPGSVVLLRARTSLFDMLELVIGGGPSRTPVQKLISACAAESAFEMIVVEPLDCSVHNLASLVSFTQRNQYSAFHAKGMQYCLS